MSKSNIVPQANDEDIRDIQIQALTEELEAVKKANAVLAAQSELGASDIIIIEVDSQKYQLMTNNVSWRNPNTDVIESVEYAELKDRTDIHEYLVANNSMVRPL